MPGRVGITTDPDARKAYWQNQVDGFKNWRVLKKFTGRKAREYAEEYETWYAQTFGCQAAPGGASARGPWYVYCFEYTKKAD